MNQEFIIQLLHSSVKVGLLLSAPFLLATLISGLIISIFQAVTQINEQTLSFIPKIISVFISGIIFGPWMLKVMIDYMQNIFRVVPKIVLLI
ncbi:type III protein export, membrane component [Buchnera aphidicola (Cinara tujafilina)]|uniref:Flagellar biosynthetic protein FliQ n=1 Tax=Buchnera aphidicola (Cinara tujafilina) TaxID=261317 RepID=F7WYZ3_9GAMM|nr:flagellar biosynthesis protein FliQ [Buchnera aphidicola]AEH39643.1 type III protein export, membrane component [Buchnera aphidicola (Cinara tujafilina)]